MVWMAFGDGVNPGTIVVIKESTHRVVRTFTNVPVSVNGMAIDSRTRTVLAAGTHNHFLVISETTGKIIKTIRMGFFRAGAAVDEATGNVYVPIVFRGIVAQFRI
jgi:DNA-binding beta-propeller fold protein YncE